MSAAKERSHSGLCKIRLERAREKGHGDQTSGAGYEFIAPLDDTGHIDPVAWKIYRDQCFVHRTENGEVLDRGLLVHRAGGPGGATWAFDYELGEGEEEAGYRFGSHPFRPGEYVSLRDEDGELRTYRVLSVSKV